MPNSDKYDIYFSFNIQTINLGKEGSIHSLLTLCHMEIVEALAENKNLRLVKFILKLQTTNKCYIKEGFVLLKSRNHTGKQRKCWLPAFSPFSTILTVFFPQVIKTQECFVKPEKKLENCQKGLRSHVQF